MLCCLEWFSVLILKEYHNQELKNTLKYINKSSLYAMKYVGASPADITTIIWK